VAHCAVCQVLYAATKSFISSFGASLAAEVRELGIDVLVFHPSPVATRFYDKVCRCPQSDEGWFSYTLSRCTLYFCLALGSVRACLLAII
jgi:short-subunit dehydrogenase